MHNSVMVHAYLYANLSDQIFKQDFEDLKSTQVICKVKDQAGKNNSIKSLYQSQQMHFSPHQTQEIIDFVNKNSKVFKCNPHFLEKGGESSKQDSKPLDIFNKS